MRFFAHGCISRARHTVGIQQTADERGRNVCNPSVQAFPLCGVAGNIPRSPQRRALCSRERDKSSSEAHRPPVALRLASGAGTAVSSSTTTDQLPRGTVTSLRASPSQGPARTRLTQQPGPRRQRLPCQEGDPEVPHLGQRLSAAETVNLHLVEAGHLHGGAAQRRPAFLPGSLSPRRTRASENSACPPRDWAACGAGAG